MKQTSNFLSGTSAYDSLHSLAFLEEHQSGNAHHMEFSSGLWVFIHIDFDDFTVFGQGFRKLVQNGS